MTALVLLVAVGHGAAEASDERELVEQAVARAAARRLGEGALVKVHVLRAALGAPAGGSLFASIPATARIGRPVRVALKSVQPDGRTVHAGEADCVIDASVRTFRTRHPVPRGHVLSAQDVEEVVVPADGWLLRPLPNAIEGARVLVDLAGGQIVHRHVVAVAPLVRSGEEVTLTLVRGGVRVETRAVATQHGQLGDVIRLLAPGTGRRLLGRVVGRGAVEVSHGS